jgi:hypothetical protein
VLSGLRTRHLHQRRRAWWSTEASRS